MTSTEEFVKNTKNLQLKVCRLLEWTTDEYSEFMYKMGIAYLHWFLIGQDKTRKKMERSKLFWNWFKIAFWSYDQAFVADESRIQSLSLKARRTLFKDLHCPIEFAKYEKPDGAVLNAILLQHA